jgi:hypothetical protein
MQRKKSVSLIAAVTVGLGVALMSTSPALAQDSRTGYRSCPGGATLVALRSESVGTDYHRIGTTANYWSSSGYHQTYSGYSASSWAAETSGAWTSQPSSFCY